MKTNQIKKTAGIFLAFMLFLGLTGTRSFSQNPQGQGNGRQGPPSAEERLKTVDEKVVKPLKLTQAKHDAVIKAYKEFYASLEKLRDEAQAQGTRPDRSKMEPLMKERDQKIQKVLSPEEFKKWQELDQANRPQRGGGQGQGQPPMQK